MNTITTAPRLVISRQEFGTSDCLTSNITATVYVDVVRTGRDAADDHADSLRRDGMHVEVCPVGAAGIDAVIDRWIEADAYHLRGPKGDLANLTVVRREITA